MSIELYLLVNLLGDMALLGATARALGVLRWRRVVACGCACTAYAYLAAVCPSIWASVPAQLLLLVLISALIARGFGTWLWLKAAALLAGAALLSGGVSAVPGLAPRGPMGVCCAALGALLLMLMLAARHPLRGDWQVSLAVDCGGGTARFAALIDTGNRLREPLSGLPVVIAEARLLKGALPASGWRRLPYGAVGGDGTMACFKPASLWIERGGRRRRAPEVWIALSPGPLPGSARALAPSEFASFI